MSINDKMSGGDFQNTRKAAELFAVHGEFLLQVFQRELPGQDSYDLWQNLFLSLVANPLPENVPNVRGYLYRAAVNDIIDFKRSAQRHKERIDEYSKFNTLRKTERSPEKDMASVESLKQVLKKIEANLPSTIGQAVIDKYVNHLSHRQIAEKMNIKKGTVDRYLSVGTKMLAQIREQIVGDDHGKA